MKSISKLTLAIAISIFFTSAYAQEFKTPLKVSKGQEFNYQTEMVMDIVQTMGGQEIKVYSSNSAVMKYAITNVLPDGGAELLTSVWDAKSRTKMMAMDTTMTFAGKVGPTYKIILNKYGNIIKKEKVDTVAINIAGANFDMENRMTASGMFVEFPEKNLQPGEKWNKESNDSVAAPGMAGKLGYGIKTDYTLGAKETIEGKELQKINFTSAIEIGGKSKMQGMDLFIEGTGIQNGDIYIDPASKVVYQSNSVIEMDMTVAVSGAQAMTIPMSQKITVTQKLKE